MSYLTDEIEARAIELAAKKLLPRVMNWLDGDGDEEEILSDLTKALDSYDLDGYHLANELDGWNPNAELVEILDDAGRLIHEFETSLVAERLVAEGITPKFSKEAIVKVPGRLLNGKKVERSKVYTGTITGFGKAGQYIINVPEAGHVPPDSNQSGTTGVYLYWKDVEAENSDLLLQPTQNSDIV